MENVALMDDHSYDVDEIFKMFPQWRLKPERQRYEVVCDYVDPMFDKRHDEQADDWATLVCAMETLYTSLDRLLLGQEVVVTHVAYYEEEQCLEFILGNQRDGRDHPRILRHSRPDPRGTLLRRPGHPPAR